MRLVGLDAWRAFLLIYGVFLHTSNLIRTIPGDPIIFNLIQSTSRVARMQAFFLIAGFLAARSIAKRGSASWFRDRLLQLFLPMAMVWLTFQRLTEWIRTGDPLSGLVEVDHLWFLILLVGFSGLTVLAQLPQFRWRIESASHAAARWPVPIFIAGVIATVFLGTLSMQAVYAAFPAIAGKEGIYSTIYLLMRVLVMVIFYVAGHVMAQADFLPRSRSALLFIVAAGAMAVYLLLFDPHMYMAAEIPGIPHAVLSLVLFFTMAVAGTCFSLGVFVHAREVVSIPSAAMTLSRASYTIYLVHLFYVALVFSVLSRLSDNHYLLFVGTAGLAMGLSLLTHFALDASPLLRLLFNGKRPARKNPAAVLA